MKYDIDSMFHRPSFITGVSGKVGELVFYMRNGRQCARAHVVPANPHTEGQETRRSLFGAAVRRWQALEDDERGKWNARAAKMPCSGYNLFIRDYMRGNADTDIDHALSHAEPRSSRRTSTTKKPQRLRGTEKNVKTRVTDDEGGPMRTRMSFSGPCGISFVRGESPAPPAHEARLLPRLRSVHALGVFLFRKRKTRSSPHGTGMQSLSTRLYLTRSRGVRGERQKDTTARHGALG